MDRKSSTPQVCISSFACLVTAFALWVAGALVLASGLAAPARAASETRALHRTGATRPRAHAAHRLSGEDCPGARDTTSAASAQVLDAAVTCLINHERESWGLPALNPNSDLHAAATDWSRWMVSHDEFDHARLSSRISASGYNWEEVGENIATGYRTPLDVVSAWMASPDHCQNILDPDWRDVGTGLSPQPVPGQAASGATWTQDFGLGMRKASPSDRYRPSDGCPYSV